MGRIAIVSASLGAGHDGAAAEIARRLRACDHTVDLRDGLDSLPFGLGRRFKEAYRQQLAVAPWSWEWTLNRLAASRLLTLFTVWLFSLLAARRLRRMIGDADAVVSTYPLAGQLFARMRRKGSLAVPLIIYLTDPSVHPLWVARGTDLYLAAHPAIAAQVKQLGGKRIAVVAPAVRPDFRPAAHAEERAKARAQFGLPQEQTLALVVSGSWAVGEIEQSAREVAGLGLVTPVVVCGENEPLRQRLSDLAPAVVLGWVDDMPTLLRACDIVVLNSGGLTFFEAHATGLPVLTYRCLAGHGRTNAQSLETAGLARWLHSSAELAATMRTMTEQVSASRAEAPVTPASATAVHTGVDHTGVDHAGVDHAGVGSVCSSVAISGMLADPARPTPAAGRRATRALGSGRGRRVRRLAVGASLLAMLLWGFNEGTSLAVSHGWRAVGDSGASRSTVFFVVDVPADQNISQQDIVTLAATRTAVAVSARTATLNPAVVRQLSTAGLLVVNSAGGKPYETGMFTGRGAIGAGAKAITVVTRHRPNLMLSDGDVDAVDVGLAALYHERIVIARTMVTCSSSSTAALPKNGGVVLVRADANCDLATTLTNLARQAAAENLRPTALENAVA